MSLIPGLDTQQIAARFNRKQLASQYPAGTPNLNPVIIDSAHQWDAISTRDYSLEYNSYAGSDIQCTIFIPKPDMSVIRDMGQQGSVYGGGFVKVNMELQTLTVSSARSVHPVRRLGEVAPATYTRGARTIAGTMIFTTLFRDAFADAYQASAEDGETDLENFFVDQIPRFNMLINAANEYGNMANSVLVGIHLTNFGTTLSIDDMYTESTYSYVARQWYPFVEDTVAMNMVLSVINDDTSASALVKQTLLNRLLISGETNKAVELAKLYRDGQNTAENEDEIIDITLSMLSELSADGTSSFLQNEPFFE